MASEFLPRLALNVDLPGSPPSFLPAFEALDSLVAYDKALLLSYEWLRPPIFVITEISRLEDYRLVVSPRALS